MASLNDETRLEAIAETKLLHAPPDDKFGRFTQLVTAVLGVPISLITLVTDEYQFFTSESGLPGHLREERQTPITHSICRYVVESEEHLVVEDAREDVDLRKNGAVREFGIVAYAGFPISTPEGEVLGSFCAIDDKPRKWSIKELSILKGFAEAIESEVGLRLEVGRRREAEKRLESDVLARTAELSEALKKSRAVEERFRTLVERTPQAIAMFDRELRYLHYSERWVEDYKLQDQGELTGRSHYDVFPTIPERWKAHHRRVLQGERLRCDEDSFLRENGAREWLRWELVPWRKSGGEIGGLIMLTEVLTERRVEQAELRRKYIELHEASEKLAQAQKEAKLVHWSWTPSTSEVKLENYRREGKVEFTLDRLLGEIQPEYHESIREQLKKAESSSASVDLEVATIDDRFLMLAGVRQGHRIAGVAQDVTELRHLKKQLRESQKMEALGLLAGGVAHDLNNILCSILLPVELSRDELESDHPVQEDLSIIFEAGKRAENLVRQLLLFSRRSEVKTQVVDVNSVVDNFRSILTKLLPKRIRLEVILADSIPKVRIDPSALEQVLMNLVVNAKDAMPESGKVSLQVQVEERPSSQKFVVVSVEDSGSGIPEEVQVKMFEPFFTTKGVGEGTGLGLSVCANIVEEAEGRLSVDSVLGQGTCIRVEFPFAEEAVAESGPVDGRNIKVPQGTERILLVDDDDSIRRILAKFLRSIGYKVSSFESPLDALQVLEREEVDLLISEVHLPSMDGREFASELRVIRPSLRAVLMSADSCLSVVGEKNLFLHKPFGKTQLALSVRQALDGN